MWYIDVIMVFLYATLYLPSSTGSLIIAVRLKYKEIYVPTVLVQSRHILTFQSTMDRIYDGGPLRL
jgi:hypothetical protein